MKFDGQDVLVVGGSSGIGEAAARACGGRGERDDRVARCGQTGGERSEDRSRRANRCDGHDRRHERTCIFESAGEFDHVVVSAAQTPTGPVRGLALADAYAAMDSKFWGAYRVARAVRIRQGGSLTFVSGFLSVRPSKTSVLQGAINAALESLARGLALELSPVRVNTVSPGLIATPLWSKLDAQARDRMYEGAAARLPAGRVGQPEDVANAVLYLASTPYATGSTVLVDGGGAIA